MARQIAVLLLGLATLTASAQAQTPTQPRKPKMPQARAGQGKVVEKKVTLNKSLCFEIETDWIDPLPATAPATHGGDFWRFNEHRPASGAKLIVKPDFSQFGSLYHLNESGCLTFEPPSDSFEVTVSSSGTVNGIGIVSYTDWGPDGPDSNSSPDLTGNFRTASKSWTLSRFPRQQTLVLEASDLENSIAWHAYALVAYALSRSDYNLGDFGNASNCGVPNNPCCGHQAWDGVDSETIYTYTMRSGSGYSSTWKDTDEIDDSGDLKVSGYGDLFDGTGSVPALGSGKLDKWQMAHELGHIIVMQRMGKRTETNYSAALYGCMGGYSNGDFSKPSDDGSDSSKAPLSREFSSGAAREGWAHFFAAQLYNDVEESDCWYDSEHFMDFDLDGDIDNDYSGTTYKDGVFTCEGAGLEPQLGEPFPKSDRLASWLHARDWLDEVWDNAPACGSASSPSQIKGRSSQYDWMRYFWDMATDENVSVKRLVDIYVDMCPTNWVAAPPDTTPNANWPERRLERSATFHGVLAKHNNQKNNGVDHD